MKKVWNFITTVFAIPAMLISELFSSIASIRISFNRNFIITTLFLGNFITGAYFYVFTDLPFMAILWFLNGIVLAIAITDDSGEDVIIFGSGIMTLIQGLIIGGIMIGLTSAGVFVIEEEDRVSWKVENIKYIAEETRGNYYLMDTTVGSMKSVNKADFYNLQNKKCETVTKMVKVNLIEGFDSHFENKIETTYICE